MLQECTRLEGAVELLREEVTTLKSRQYDIEREAEMVANMLVQAEHNSDLSATRLVEEALANCAVRGSVDGALTATALVRDALAHHAKDSNGGQIGRSPSMNSRTSGNNGLPASSLSPCSLAHSPAAPRVVSFAYDVAKLEDAGVAGAGATTGNDAGSAAENRQLAAENHGLREELKAMTGKLQEMEGQLSEAAIARASLEAKAKQIEEAADRDIDTNLRISIGEANRRVSQVQGQLTAAVAERDEARRVSQDLKAMLGEVLQRQSADAQQHYERENAERERMRKQAEDSLRLHGNELDLLRRRTEALQAENAALHMWKEGCDNDRERTRHANHKHAEREAHAQQQTIASLRAERADLEKERQALLLKSERLADECERAKAELAALRRTLEELEDQHASACDELAQQSQRLNEVLAQQQHEQRLGGQARDGQDAAYSLSAKGDIVRLRECNRLLILELEDTRQRLLAGRRGDPGDTKGLADPEDPTGMAQHHFQPTFDNGLQARRLPEKLGDASCAEQRGQSIWPSPQPVQSAHGLADASVMNLSRAAVRELSSTPKVAVSSGHDVSLIGLTSSAVREASMPPTGRSPLSLSMQTRQQTGLKNTAICSEGGGGGDGPAAKLKSGRIEKSMGPRAAPRRPLAALTPSKINLRGV